MRSLSYRCCPLLLCLALLGAGPLRAEEGYDLAEAKQRFLRGAEHYRLGRFDEAREDFAASFRLSGRIALLYNLALTEDKLSNTQAAIAYLERYVVAPEITDRPAAQAFLDRLRQRQALTSAPRHYDGAPPLRIAAWSSGAVGLAGVIAGAALLGVDGRPTCDSGPQACKYLLDTRAAGAVVLTGGLLVLGGAVTLFILDRKSAPRRPALAAPLGRRF